jgi:hypothetical protein
VTTFIGGDGRFVALGGDAVDAAGHGFGLLVGHVMAADAGVVPVRDVERAVGSDTGVAGAEPIVLAGEEVDDPGLVAGAVLLHGVGADDAGAGVAVDHLAAEDFGEQVAFVDAEAGGGTGAGLEEVGDDARIVEMPMALGNVILLVGATRAPAGAGHFVGVAVVAELHHEVDADALIAVVVVVRLPEGAEGIDGDLVVVAEVPADGVDAAEPAGSDRKTMPWR